METNTEKKRRSLLFLAGTVLIALVLWFFTFHIAWGNFWIKISVSAGLLCCIALACDRRRINWAVRPVDILIGMGSAGVLYFIFWLGNYVSTQVLDFAPEQIGNIYARGEGTPSWIICSLLISVTSPAEEIYWRGFLQEHLHKRFGGAAGWILATTCYAFVHLPAWNFMLIGAAAVAGAFWGLMYWRTRRIAPLIISHAAWSVTIFALVPVR